MKIMNLNSGSKIYTSNSYLLLGDYNALVDVNTLIDAGRDPKIIDKIKEINTGVGKKKIDQVIITHEHFDHMGLVSRIKKEFRAKVYAFNKSEHVDHTVRDGDRMKMGDLECEIIHTPGHTHDSICIYCEPGGILFSGDTPLQITTSSFYEDYYIQTIEKLGELDIRAVYPGHGEPLFKGVRKMIKESLKNMKHSSSE